MKQATDYSGDLDTAGRIDLTNGIRSDTLERVYNEYVLSHFGVRAWITALRDPVAKARIVARVRSAEHGNFGDCEPVGGSVFEMRIHCGPGYRLYYTRRETLIYLLLCGGDKSNQKRDIKRAKAMLKKLPED